MAASLTDEDKRAIVAHFFNEDTGWRWRPTIAQTYDWAQDQWGAEVTYEQVRRIVNDAKTKRGERMMRLRPRDSQRSRLYKWEQRLRREHRDTTPQEMSLDDCDRLIARAYRVYGLKWSGRTVAGKSERHSATGSRFQVSLPRWARQPIVVLHEAAHGILNTLEERGDYRAPHGPEFARIMIELWHHFGYVKRECALGTLLTSSVKITAEGKWYPPAVATVAADEEE